MIIRFSRKMRAQDVHVQYEHKRKIWSQDVRNIRSQDVHIKYEQEIESIRELLFRQAGQVSMSTMYDTVSVCRHAYVGNFNIPQDNNCNNKVARLFGFRTHTWDAEIDMTHEKYHSGQIENSRNWVVFLILLEIIQLPTNQKDTSAVYFGKFSNLRINPTGFSSDSVWKKRWTANR